MRLLRSKTMTLKLVLPSKGGSPTGANICEGEGAIARRIRLPFCNTQDQPIESARQVAGYKKGPALQLLSFRGRATADNLHMLNFLY